VRHLDLEGPAALDGVIDGKPEGVAMVRIDGGEDIRLEVVPGGVAVVRLALRRGRQDSGVEIEFPRPAVRRSVRP
jgi:hypothetical protein